MKTRLALTVFFLSTFLIYPSAVPASSDNVELLNWWPSGKCVSAAYDDNHVYFSMGATLVIADVTTPSAPVELGTLTMGDEVASIAVSGDYAYVANRQNGLRVIDISTPGSPAEVGYYVTPGSAHRVTVEGAYAYVLTSEATLRVIDITTPSNPVEIGTLGIDEAVDVVTSGDYACVAAMSRDLRVVDVSTPSSPTEVGSYSTPGYAGSVDFDPLNTRATVGASGLRVISVETPSSPLEVGYCCYYDTEIADVLVAGNNCFVLATIWDLGMWYGGCRLSIVDISDPVPAYVGHEYLEHNDFYDMDYGSDHVYVANGSSGLRVIDVTTPANPYEIGHIRTGDVVENVTIVGDYAYVANAEAGLTILDVSDPGAPVETGYYDHGDNQNQTYHFYNRTLDVTVSGDYAFLAESQGLLILDVSDPSTPALVGWYAPYCCTGPSQLSSVTVSGDHAYAGWGTGLMIIDITNPSHPHEVGNIYSAVRMQVARTVVSGDYAYLATWDQGLRVVDVSDPTTPVEIGTYIPSGTNVRDLALSGDYAYLADYTAGLRIVDVSTPSSPVEVSRYDTPGTAYAVEYSGGYAFVADGTGGLRVINVANPAAPEEVAYGGTSFPATSVAVDGNDVYVGSDDGMYVMRLDPALVGVTTTSSFKSALHQNHPNPFNPSTTLRYELADAGRVNLTIYSVEGKHVRTLLDEVKSAGSHDVVWDGRNDSGVRVGSGVYFCTMRAGSYVQTRRLVLLK